MLRIGDRRPCGREACEEIHAQARLVELVNTQALVKGEVRLTREAQWLCLNCGEGEREQVPPDEVTGEFAQWEMDADERLATLVMRPALAVEPIRVTLPFLMVKETAAQILLFEVSQDNAVAIAEGRNLTVGQQHKKVAAEQILRECDNERKGVTDRGGDSTVPEPPRQIPGFDL